jgi:hypothetical protein
MTPEEIARDKAIAAADDVAGTWTNNDGKRKPGKSVFIVETATEELDVDGSGRPSRYGPSREYVCNAFTVERAAAIANAHNRLPAYIAAAEEADMRIRQMLEDCKRAVRGAKSDGSYGYDTNRTQIEYEAKVEALEKVLEILRGGK